VASTSTTITTTSKTKKSKKSVKKTVKKKAVKSKDIKEETTAYITDNNIKEAIAYITDNDKKTIDCLCTSVESLLRHSDRHIFIICRDVSANNQELIKSIFLSAKFDKYTIISIDSKDFDINSLSNLGRKAGVTPTAFLKFYLKKLVPDTVERLLYLDADTYVCKPLDELFEIDLSGKFLGVCHDRVLEKRVENYSPTASSFSGQKLFYSKENTELYQRIIANNGGYFNSGVLLFNLKMFNDSLINILANYEKAHGSKHVFIDQDTLNIILGNNVVWLDQKFNMFPPGVGVLKKRFKTISWKELINTSVIIHYTGHTPSKSKFQKALKHYPLEIAPYDPEIGTVISMTTYPTRCNAPLFKRVIDSLLNQKVPSSKIHICVTLEESDIPKIDKSVLEYLDKNNIEVLVAKKNFRPHLKYYYAFKKYPGNPIITVDDDVIANPGIIEELIQTNKEYGYDMIISGRVQRITFDSVGKIRPYDSWVKNITVSDPHDTINNFFLGIGSVYYPPAFVQIVNNTPNLDELIEKSITADDFLLNHIAFENGVECALVKSKNPFYHIGGHYSRQVDFSDSPSYNDSALYRINIREGQNDVIMARLRFRALDPLPEIPNAACYIVDDNFVKLTCWSILSLGKTNPNIHVFVVLNEVSSQNIEVLKSTLSKSGLSSWSFIDAVNGLDGYKQTAAIIKENSRMNHVTSTAAFKFILPQLIPETTTRLIYLDGDTIINGDILELFDIDLTEKYAGVVLDTSLSVNGKEVWFNSGVMVLNLELIRKNDISTKLIQHKMEKPSKYVDQGAFNDIFSDKILWLDGEYNFIIKDSLFDKDNNINPDVFKAKIFHAAGDRKNEYYATLKSVIDFDMPEISTAPSVRSSGSSRKIPILIRYTSRASKKPRFSSPTKTAFKVVRIVR
jgi:lipopolysaccharide biosynthesis glycosyltransferase